MPLSPITTECLLLIYHSVGGEVAGNKLNRTQANRLVTFGYLSSEEIETSKGEVTYYRLTPKGQATAQKIETAKRLLVRGNKRKK